MPADVDFGGLDIPIVGFEIVEVWFSGRTYLIAYGHGELGVKEAPRSQIGLSGKFRLSCRGASAVRLDAGGDWADLSPLFSLRHRTVAVAAVSASGDLHLEFDDDSSLDATSDDRYEAWEVAGPGSINLVAPPGGGDPRVTWDERTIE